MIDYNVMNEKFMQKSVLSTKELLAIGLNSHDLTRLVKEGKLERNCRGYYSLPIADVELVYSLVDVIERVCNGETVVMLEPLEEKDASFVLATVSNISCIRPFVVIEDGKTRIILRSICVENFTYDVSDLLTRAECFYDSGFYDAYINVVDTILPSIDNPSSDMYLKLGFSYQQLIANDVNNASKMIDYLTLAAATSEAGKGKLLVDFMREKYKYNGVRINSDFSESANCSGVQYKINIES